LSQLSSWLGRHTTEAASVRHLCCKPSQVPGCLLAKDFTTAARVYRLYGSSTGSTYHLYCISQQLPVRTACTAAQLPVRTA
jgi:hypothetical protein